MNLPHRFVERLQRPGFIRLKVVGGVLGTLQTPHVERRASEFDVSPLQIAQFADTQSMPEYLQAIPWG